MRKIPYRGLMVGLLVLLAVAGWWRQSAPAPQAPTHSSAATESVGNQTVAAAFERQQSNVQLQGRGRVVKTLPDDNQGSRHQRFILRLDNQHTVLVAHNIDLAPRLPGLRKGDEVAFYGVYEYNPQGGVVHWTHHDPAGRHTDGWLEYQGRRYQ